MLPTVEFIILFHIIFVCGIRFVTSMKPKTNEQKYIFTEKTVKNVC